MFFLEDQIMEKLALLGRVLRYMGNDEEGLFDFEDKIAFGGEGLNDLERDTLERAFFGEAPLSPGEADLREINPALPMMHVGDGFIFGAPIYGDVSVKVNRGTIVILFEETMDERSDGVLYPTGSTHVTFYATYPPDKYITKALVALRKMLDSAYLDGIERVKEE